MVRAGDAYMSSLMCSYFILILLLSKMFVFCVFLYSCIILIRDLFFATCKFEFTFYWCEQKQSSKRCKPHAIARFLIVPLGIKIHSIAVHTRKYAIQCKEDFVASNPKIFGSYALHTDPKSEAILDVCQFEDEMTRDRSPRVQVVWVLEY